MAGNMTGILSKTRLSFCLISRRGYGAAVSQAETESIKSTLKSKGKQEEEKGTSESLSWVPDPVTGYYKPSGQTNGPSGQISGPSGQITGPTGPKQEE